MIIPNTQPVVVRTETGTVPVVAWAATYDAGPPIIALAVHPDGTLNAATGLPGFIAVEALDPTKPGNLTT